MKKEINKFQIVVESRQNVNTGGDIVGERIAKNIREDIEPNILSLSENNYTLKFFGERFINPFKLSKIIKNLNKKSVILFNYYFDISSLILLMMSNLKGNKNIVAFHTFFKKGILLIDVVYFFKRIFLLNFALLIADRLVFLTRKQQNYFKKYTLLKKTFFKKSIIIPNGVDKKNIIKRKKNIYKLNLIYIGRLISQKGIDSILKITREINLFSRFIIIGSGNKKIEKGLKENKPIKYLKEVAHKKIYKYYDSSNILLLPSYSETWGLVILEAMARGLVVLASDLPAIREYFKDGRNGYLFPPGDAEKMKKLILYLKNNPKEIKRISRNNLKDIYKFTTEKQVSKYIKIYNELSKENKKNGKSNKK